MASPVASLPLVTKTGTKAPAEALSGKVVCLYFSAHWCPPCRGFTPALRQFYESLKAAGESIEIIFVSSDRGEQEFKDYFANEHGDWLAVDFSASRQREELSKHYQIRGIPALIVVDGHGKPAVPDARNDVAGAKGAAAASAAFATWKKAAGTAPDWRETQGSTLGGGDAKPMDAAGMRAARLARLGGGGAPAPAAAPAVAPAASSAATPAAATAAAPTAVAPAAAPAADLIAQLTAMGFGEEQARKALEAAGGNVEQATSILLG